MRYELGVLQLLVASGGKRNTTQVKVVERALGARPGSLDPALRLLQGRGLVNPDGQPTNAGVSRAKGLSRQIHDAMATVHLPTRLPSPRRVFQNNDRDSRNDFDLDTVEEDTVDKDIVDKDIVNDLDRRGA